MSCLIIQTCLEIARDAVQKEAWGKLLKETVRGVCHWVFMARRGLGVLTRAGMSPGPRSRAELQAQAVEQDNAPRLANHFSPRSVQRLRDGPVRGSSAPLWVVSEMHLAPRRASLLQVTELQQRSVESGAFCKKSCWPSQRGGAGARGRRDVPSPGLPHRQPGLWTQRKRQRSAVHQPVPP